MTRPLRIALVNNMPDAALKAAARQFSDLACASAPGEVVFSPFHFPSTARAAPAAAWLNRVSRPVSELDFSEIDAAIVTGAEPRAGHLRDEAYFPEFTALVDKAAAAKAFVLWSCLAAHAAVLHLAGVERRRLDQKLSGVFEVERFADHPGAAWAPQRFATPQSRWNTLPVGALMRAGGRLISGSAEVGADAFTLDGLPGSLFSQGHPEYAADTLLREFRRDLSRFVEGEAAPAPRLPVGMLTVEEAVRLSDPLHRLRPGDRAALSGLEAELDRLKPRAIWRSGAQALVGYWLSEAATAAGAKDPQRRRAG